MTLSEEEYGDLCWTPEVGDGLTGTALALCWVLAAGRGCVVPIELLMAPIAHGPYEWNKSAPIERRLEADGCEVEGGTGCPFGPVVAAGVAEDALVAIEYSFCQMATACSWTKVIKFV